MGAGGVLTMPRYVAIGTAVAFAYGGWALGVDATEWSIDAVMGGVLFAGGIILAIMAVRG